MMSASTLMHSQNKTSDNNHTPDQIISNLGVQSKNALHALRDVDSDTISNALKNIADAVIKSKHSILDANEKDMSAAKKKGLSEALLDRLKLNTPRLEAMAEGVRAIANMDDPAGRVLWETMRPNGLKIKRIAVPIGVLGMIYKSRPNVTVDAAALCLKSRNAVILRGGSESFNSAQMLHQIIKQSLLQSGLPEAAISMVPNADRDLVGAMLKADHVIDVMIPRGGRKLIERVMAEARMPVFSHLEGLCHIYIHESANEDIAHDVTVNAKLRRTGVCGSLETLLLDQNLPSNIISHVLKSLLDQGCEIVGDDKTQSFDKRIKKAKDQDWRTEYLDKKLSVKFVEGVDQAVQHINYFGSHHTDSILCEDKDTADYFLKHVDSGIVIHNASTQFADGGEFGMGAEIGIATGKLHARGPVGLEQLCSYKYIVEGSGQIRPS